MKKLRKNKKGFTLVELMIVIVIMVILAAAATPILSGYLKKARATEHLADCRSLYVAAQTYFEELKASEGTFAEDALLAEVKELSSKDEVLVEAGTTGFSGTDDSYTVYYDNANNTCTAVVWGGADDGDWVFNPVTNTYEKAPTTP